jgi:2-oxoglutarate dehydrogenase E2 component (dihydrolipoamide succinyltransferase)
MTETIFVPRINPNDNKVEIGDWYVLDDEYVEVGRDVVDLETSKVSITIAAETGGFVRRCLKKGSVARIGDPLYVCAASIEDLARIATHEAASSAVERTSGLQCADVKPSPAWPAASSLFPPRESGATRFSRAALTLMKVRGLAPEQFHNCGLVTARMIELSSRPAASMGAAATEAKPTAQLATMRKETVSLRKQAEIKSLTLGESGNINSTLSVQFESCAIRARLRSEGILGGNIQPLILYEVSRLVKKWPQLTAYYANEQIHYYDRVDLGLAVDLGRGLKVVAIRGADQLLPIQLYEATLDIGQRYLENLIRNEELVESTLTITDLSGLDIFQFHPLINGAQSAIIGVGGDRNMAGHPMTLNVTFDHRVTSGREMAGFLGALRDRLLSYAPALTERPAALVESSDNSASSFRSSCEIACDVCGMDHSTYLRDFERDARMLAYFRDDGSMGRICHICHSSQ